MKKKTIKRFILFVVIMAVILLFLYVQKQFKYSEESEGKEGLAQHTLPEICFQYADMKTEHLLGSVQPRKTSAIHNFILPIDDTNEVNLEIIKNKMGITNAYFEVRDLSSGELIQKESIEISAREEENSKYTLKLSNLIEKQETYRLQVVLETTIGEFYYDAKIISLMETTKDLEAFALKFATSIINKNENFIAQYIAPDESLPNNSFATVTNQSTMQSIVWGNQKPILLDQRRIRFTEITNGQITLSYLYQVQLSDENNMKNYYHVEESICVRTRNEKIYLENYKRTTERIFTGTNCTIANNQVYLGIQNPLEIDLKHSSDKKWTAFVVNHNVWVYDQENHSFFKVYDSNISEKYRKYSYYNRIKLINIDDDGIVRFLVYGSFQKGKQGGQEGVALYEGNIRKETVEQKVMIKTDTFFEKMNQGVGDVLYQNQEGILFFNVADKLYSYHFKANELVTQIEAFDSLAYSQSAQENLLAWPEKGKTNSILLFDMEKREQRMIINENGYASMLGYVGDDIAYMTGSEKNSLMVADYEIAQMADAIIIEDFEGVEKSRYEKADYFILDAQVDSKGIVINRIAKEDRHDLMKVSVDLVVVTNNEENEPPSGIHSVFDPNLKSCLYINVYTAPLDSNIAKTHSIEVTNEKSLEIENDYWKEAREETLFSAYASGHFILETNNLTEAIAAVFHERGAVYSENELIWDRSVREISVSMPAVDYETILEEFDQSNYLALKKADINYLLKYINDRRVVLAVGENGEYVFLVGYDTSHITIFEPQTNERTTMTISQANNLFKHYGSVFFVEK